MRTLSKYEVSVVIPSIGRETLNRAVRSALGQVGCDVEVIVVLDRPEVEDRVKAELAKYRVFVLTTDGSEGPSVARNIGLMSATREYVGFLDDDDEWLPNKAKLQIAALQRSEPNVDAFALSYLEFVTSGGRVRSKEPQKFVGPAASFANFLLARRHLLYGDSYFLTPSLLATRSLLLQLPWDESLRIHEDWDLFLRLVSEVGAGVVYVDEVLTRVYQGSEHSISAKGNWRSSLGFLRKHSTEITGRARADFVLVHMLQHAIRERSKVGIRESIQSLPIAIPHLGGLLRFVAGVIPGVK